MRLSRLAFSSLTLLLVMATFIPARGAGTSCDCTGSAPSSSGSDCSVLKNVAQDQYYKIDPTLTHHCSTLSKQASDPPCCLRKNGGVSAGIKLEGAGGFSHGVIQAPDKPPGAVGAPPDVDQQTINGSQNFPPWNGWPFNTGSSGGGTSSGASGGSSGGGTCPTNDEDTSGTFGVQQQLVAGSVSLTCGGAIPLTTYQMTLTAGADSLMLTEYGQPYYWIWQRSGNNYRLVTNGAPLPTTLCGGGNLAAPIAQMTSFNSHASQITVRLITQATGDPLSPPATPEKYLIFPLSGGVPNVPKCAADNNYQAPGANVGDLVFEMVSDGGCEAPPATCQKQGLSQTPTALANCELETLYPSGGSCKGNTQIALLDRPNLIYPPGSSPTVASIDSMTAFMVGTTAGSAIYAQESTVLEVGGSAQALTFPTGATLGLNGNYRLAINGPVTITASGNQVTMTNGGILSDSGGNVIQQFQGNTVMTISKSGALDFTTNGNEIAISPPQSIFFPLTLESNGILNMPTGYMAPGSPDGKVRLPVPPPQ